MDIKFRPRKNPSTTTTDLFAVATSTGSIILYTIIRSPEGDEEQLKIREALPIQVMAKSDVITSLAWDVDNHSQIHVTASSGRVATIDMGVENFAAIAMTGLPLIDKVSDGSTGHLEVLKALGSHSLEAWIVEPAFIHASSGEPVNLGLLTGGDDAVMNLYSPAPAFELQWSNRKVHQAGVTTFRPLTNTKNGMVVATGSYDDHLRILEISKSTGRAEVLTELNLGGGVWRIVVLPKTSVEQDRNVWRLLISCMYNGAMVVRVACDVDLTTWQDIVVEKHLQEHQSMCYAAEVMADSGASGSGQCAIVSCSFYDRRLCLWRA